MGIPAGSTDLERLGGEVNDLVAVGVEEPDRERVRLVRRAPRDLDLDRERARQLAARDGPAASEDEQLSLRDLRGVGENHRCLHAEPFL